MARIAKGADMSFDLFVCPLPGSVWGETERRRIFDILHRDGDTSDPGWAVRYGDRDGVLEISGLDSSDQEAGEMRSLCFRRFGGRTFTDRLYALADRLDAMVFWPSVDRPMVAVTRPDLFARLPAELAPGDAVVVRDADDLMAQICK